MEVLFYAAIISYRFISILLPISRYIVCSNNNSSLSIFYTVVITLYWS